MRQGPPGLRHRKAEIRYVQRKREGSGHGSSALSGSKSSQRKLCSSDRSCLRSRPIVFAMRFVLPVAGTERPAAGSPDLPFARGRRTDGPLRMDYVTSSGMIWWARSMPSPLRLFFFSFLFLPRGTFVLPASILFSHLLLSGIQDRRVCSCACACVTPQRTDEQSRHGGEGKEGFDDPMLENRL